ncbi:MAG TPA: R3H domain-containing nucleic acid-binding protein [Thermoanaerobaculia bacterium]|nr:R3H domain-containing nucleic acid-binding protein [Thermoanaerobaculia bacterium]
MSQRFEGRNLEEALTAAATAFGVERYQLTYHVLLEKRGFLGGMKRVVIEAEINDTAPPPEEVAAPQPARGERERSRGSDRPRERSGRRRGGRRGERSDRPSFRREEPDDLDDAPVEAPEQGEESPTASDVRVWCEQVLRLTNLSGVLRTEENETQIIVRIYGRDARRLTDRNGELLDALQVLANKSLGGRKVEKDIELDCAEFKQRRVADLGEQARETADRVRRDGREQLLPSMSPIERRIVHMALADDADVTTESRGDGFYKRVAIIPRPAADQQPEP